MIDWTQVSQLREEIGEEAFTEVAEAFLAEVEGGLDDLCAGRIAAGGMEDAYHALKGSALNLGFTHFAEACAEAEADARAGRPLPDPKSLRQDFRTQKAEFVRELPERFAA